jgi:putative SOS response-associated peptidase YedK
MCGRVTVRTSAREIAALFDLVALDPFPHRYNIVPTQQLLAVRSTVPEAQRRANWLRWGLLPPWTKELSTGQTNARAETIAGRPSFRSAFRERRCLIIADGFYEWNRNRGTKSPYHIRRKDGLPFAFAGIWERWANAGQPLETCAVVTTASNDFMLRLHDRMPVILPSGDYDAWLGGDDSDALQHLLRTRETPELEMIPVSTWVNSARHDDERCLQPVAEDSDGRQQFLF